MQFCLSCYHFSPDSALFCTHCGRTFGARLCPKLHPSPMGAVHCVQCGKTNLTTPTRFVHLGWISRLLAWACVIGGCKWLLSHGSGVAALTSWTLIHVFHTYPGILEQQLVCHTFPILELLVIGFVVLAMIPGETGKKLRQVASRLPRWALGAFRILWAIVRMFLRALGLVVGGGEQAARNGKKRK